LSRLKVGKGAAIASVLLDRLLGVISILVVAAIGLWLAGRSDLLSSRAVWVSLLTATATSALGSAVIFSERAAAATRRLVRRLPGQMTRGLADELTDATRAYARFHRQLGNVLIGSLAVQVLRIVGAYCLGRALNINASLGVYFAFIPIILLVMLLPISINGIGPSQLAFVWLFGLAATPAAEAFALSILFVGLGVVGNLPGGILYAWQPTPRAMGS
jgi:uncharacterized membrane protein YbhN (UPF0104 family)